MVALHCISSSLSRGNFLAQFLRCHQYPPAQPCFISPARGPLPWRGHRRWEGRLLEALLDTASSTWCRSGGCRFGGPLSPAPLVPVNGAGEIQPAVSRNWLLTPWAGRAPRRRCVRCLRPCGQGDEQSMLSRGGFEFKACGSEPLLLASANKMLRLIKRPDPGGRFKQDALGLEARGLSAFPRAQTCERPGSGRFAACGGDGAELPAQVLHRHR